MTYLLGVDPKERRRLQFQDKVWGPVTAAMIERAGAKGRCLDVGSGVGLVARHLKKPVCLEPSPVYADILRRQGYEVIQSDIDGLRTDRKFDLITCRWVFLFIEDLEPRIAKLAKLLKPGGRLAVQDYHDYEGMTLYPKSPAFEELIPAARKWFRDNGGDLRVAGRLPAAMRKAGLAVVDFKPNVLAGDGKSDVFKWAGLFFLEFAERMGGPELAARYAREWEERRKDPAARFVSPIVFDVIGRASR